jgi:methyltransferase-like protein/cyclopropane fatty-acyl-phospholipid synthase-like methyltransferase
VQEALVSLADDFAVPDPVVFCEKSPVFSSMGLPDRSTSTRWTPLMPSSPYPRTSYDEVPYPSHPFPYTHPDHLAVSATLLGLSPARADCCRVLELGCASGGNLIPLAYTYPDSTFLGIDLSVEQIRQGEELRAALGLTNVELRALNLLEIDDQFGTFDFIICHGVYSWVPAAVQDKILEICARRLAPEGIGFVSYNTFPGWHMRGMIRAMMLLHDRRFRDLPAAERVAEARGLLTFLAEAVPRENTPYSLLLRQHLEQLSACTDPYLFHEHLEECNQPIYFIEFCERLVARGLRYLGESEFRVMVPSTSFSPEVQDRLRALAPSLLEMEQYMDFLRNRMFRQTLIGHAWLRPRYEVRADRLSAFRVASTLRPRAPAPDLASHSVEEFVAENGMSLTTSTPLVKAAFIALGELWPRAVAFEDLRALARSRLEGPGPGSDPEDPAADASALGRALLTAYASGERLMELWLRPPTFAAEAGVRPLASRLARFEAAGTDQVTNLRHESVNLGPLDARLLRLLDGTRERTDLVEALLQGFHEGEVSISQGGRPVSEIAQAREILGGFIAECLHRFARAALLLG